MTHLQNYLHGWRRALKTVLIIHVFIIFPPDCCRHLHTRYIYIHIWMLCVHIKLYVHTYKHTYTYIYTHTMHVRNHLLRQWREQSAGHIYIFECYIYIFKYTYIHICVFIYTYMHIHTCTYTCRIQGDNGGNNQQHTNIHIWMLYIHIKIYVHTYIHTYIHTYTYTHTLTESP